MLKRIFFFHSSLFFSFFLLLLYPNPFSMAIRPTSSTRDTQGSLNAFSLFQGTTHELISVSDTYLNYNSQCGNLYFFCDESLVFSCSRLRLISTSSYSELPFTIHKTRPYFFFIFPLILQICYYIFLYFKNAISLIFILTYIFSTYVVFFHLLNIHGSS